MSERENTFIKMLQVATDPYTTGKSAFIDKEFHRASLLSKKINKHNLKLRAAADFALDFVSNIDNDLSQLDLTTLSDIMRDLKSGYRAKGNPRQQEFAEAIDKIHSLAIIKAERYYTDKNAKPLPLYEAESLQSIVGDYLKFGNHDAKTKKTAEWLRRRAKKNLAFYNPAPQHEEATVQNEADVQKSDEPKAEVHEPQQTVVNQIREPIRPLPDKPIVRKTAKTVEDTASLLEKSCIKNNVSFVRVDNDAEKDIVYNFYGSKPRNRDDIVGSLTVHSAKEMTLNSNDLAHFIVMAETARQGGSSVLTVGKLSENEAEAKAFAARLVLAGAITGMEVKQPYSLEELRESHPKINILIEKQNIRNEMNAARQIWKDAKASGDETKIAEAEKALQEKMTGAIQKHIHGENLNNRKTPQEKQQAAEKALAKTSDKNPQKAVNEAVLKNLQSPSRNGGSR